MKKIYQFSKSNIKTLAKLVNTTDEVQWFASMVLKHKEKSLEIPLKIILKPTDKISEHFLPA